MSLTNLKNDCVLAKLPVPIKFGQVVCCVGKKAAGKTTLIKNLLSILMDSTSTSTQVVVAAAGHNSEYENWSSHVFHDATEELFATIINHQKHAKKNGTVQNMVLVLDDVFLENVRSTNLKFLITCGRHLSVTLIIAMQYVELPSDMMLNVDTWFMRDSLANSQKQRVWQQIWNQYATYYEFNAAYTQICAEPWSWMCCTAREDSTFWYKSCLVNAPPIAEFNFKLAIESEADKMTELRALRDELNDTISTQIQIRKRLDELLR